MSIRRIHTHPDPVLKTVAEPVAEITGEVRTLIDDMIETMYDAPGIGLAAPQVGVSKRVIVIDVSHIEEEQPLVAVINPEIVAAEGVIESEEGCLSVPGYTNFIERSEKVVVRGYDRDGRAITLEGTGLFGRALQHEIDHLNGVLFIDRLTPLKKEYFKRRYAPPLSTR